MIYVLGLDAATITGWALLSCSLELEIKVHGHGTTGEVRPTDGVQVAQIFDALTSNLPWLNPAQTVVVHERLFLPGGSDRKGKNRHKAVSTLRAQLAAGRWLGIAEERGYLIYHYHDGEIGVPPGAWRTGELGKRQWTKEKAKAAALKRAARVYGVELPSSRHHQAEAICIGAFGARDIRETARKARAERTRENGRTTSDET